MGGWDPTDITIEFELSTGGTYNSRGNNVTIAAAHRTFSVPYRAVYHLTPSPLPPLIPITLHLTRMNILQVTHST